MNAFSSCSNTEACLKASHISDMNSGSCSLIANLNGLMPLGVGALETYAYRVLNLIAIVFRSFLL